MFNKLKILIILFIISIYTSADNLTPADVYYRDNIAVNEISTNTPLEHDPDDDLNPPDGGEGEAEWVGGPLKDGIFSILFIIGVYCLIKLRKNEIKYKSFRNNKII